MFSFTQEDLVQYVYKETSPEKTAAIRAALDVDWILHEKFQVIADAHKRLDSLDLFSPSQKSIDNILSYAEKSIGELTTEI